VLGSTSFRGAFERRPLNDVGIGQCETAQWCNVRKARRDVVGYLLTVTSIADHEDRRRPYFPEGAEQFVVAYMVKVQVRQVQGRELAYQVPVLGAHTLGVALVDST